ncbi:MAG: hypothetical protein GY898_04920 [Proteobacteria bacterium]|nr:hypothetical protein [Pseudomonadota bacterium]
MNRFPRIVHVQVQPEQIAVAVGVTQHAGPAAGRMRSQFDMDSNGALSDDEQEGLAEWLDRKARPHLRLTLDDVPVRMERRERKLTLERDSGTLAGDGFKLRSVTAVDVVVLPGTHVLVLEDKPANEGTLIPWRIDLPRGWAMTAGEASEGATPPVRAGEHTWQVAFSGTGGRVEVTLEVPARVGSAVEP